MDSRIKLKSLLRSGKLSYAEVLIDEELKNAQSQNERSHWLEQLGVLRSLRGSPECLTAFHEALQLDPNNLSARWNYELLIADQFGRTFEAPPPPKEARTRIAVLSFLFNWPSTGGGIVHTVELCDFLQRAGYEVEHFYARYDPWELGVVKQSTPMKSHELHFHESHWNLHDIQRRYREAVTAFHPDYVIVTDSWNMKPVLAEAIEQFPYLLRLQALECLCPLNNIRLLPDGKGGLRQCQLHQLATPNQCRDCVRQNGQRSGSLHRDERQLAEVESPQYEERLKKVFRQAHAVLVVNPLTEAMVAPYSERVRTVTAGMDPARFPDVWPDDPAPQTERALKQILFAGLIDETIKGFAVLHEAGQRLSRKRQDFELLVTADPIGRIDYFTRTVGWQTQASLPRVMRGADIIAVPAVAQEALGRTAVEAMGAGRPVVASRLGGLPFTIPDGATGLLFEPGSPDDLAAKLEQLLDHSDLRTRLGAAGRQRFLEHYVWPVIIEKHYLPLLGAPRT